LLDRERSQLLSQARRHSHRPEDADDALSDACVQFLRFYDVGSERDSLPWMLVVVKRCAWQITRRTRTRESRHQLSAGEWIDDQLAIVVADERRGPAERTERAEETAKTIALIEELKPDERTALILLGLGCTYKEIAELRGWSRTKVNRCLSQGKAKVRQRLKGVNRR
jgi:RNA polymerase sigma factor (sigma-70 family)